MAFEKGNDLGKGRPIGAKNKTSNEIRETLSLFLSDNEEEFNSRMSSLNDKDYCAMYLKMIKLVIPPIKSVYFTVLEPKPLKEIEWINQ